MPDIDLTPMNEAAARALYAEETAEIVLDNYPRLLGAEEKAKYRIAAREQAKAMWDDGTSVPGVVMFKYRDRALAVTLASYKDVARQGWQACVDELAEDEDRDDRSVDRLRSANPYEVQS